MRLEQWQLRESDGMEDRQAANEYRPHIDAVNADSEPDRIDRLRRIYKMAQTLFLLVESRPLPIGVVVAIHDGKGHLTVTGSSQEWADYIAPFFRLAWRSEGEPELQVTFAARQ